MRPDRAGIVSTASANVPLLARTVLLRTSLLIMTFVAASQGDVALAGHQVAFTLWYFLAMPPEAFAIASQAMVGHALGAAEPATAKALSRRALAWGLGSGLAMAILLLALRQAYIPIFTTDQEVRDLIWSLVVVVAASQPVGALLYVLDGILIGAGDTRFLAWAMLAALLTFLPLAAWVLVTEAGVVALWWALTGWLLVRQVAVALRYRSSAWLGAGPVPTA
jgi:putative MATE family efflux protein